MTPRHIVLTGGSSLTGTWFARALVDADHEAGAERVGNDKAVERHALALDVVRPR